MTEFMSGDGGDSPGSAFSVLDEKGEDLSRSTALTMLETKLPVAPSDSGLTGDATLETTSPVA